MRLRRSSGLGAVSERLWVDESLGATLFEADSYVARSEARALHRGERALDGPGHFILPLRRALARISPGAFDSPPRPPWRVVGRRGGVVQLGVGGGDREVLEAAVEAAIALGLSVHDGMTGETTQPMELDRTDFLADALGDLDDSGYVILEGGPGHGLYVQAFGEGPGQMRLEAVSRSYLPAARSGVALRGDALAILGFEPPNHEIPNFFRMQKRGTRASLRDAAARMVNALVEGYGADRSESYQLRTSATEFACES